MLACGAPAAAPTSPPSNQPPVAVTPPQPKPLLALTPPMGFNNWNAFGCDVSEALIKQTADFLVSSGLKDAGYVHVNVDDCWSLRERGADGRLVADPVKFPSGIAGLAAYVHERGLKLGIYGDAGTKTCAGYPGSLGREKLDAETWASWGVDYLKYDNCYNQSDGSRADFVRRYTAMREALDSVPRPIVYSICEWGQSQPWEWAKGVGHLWRTTGDISDDWPSVREIIAANAKLAAHAGPGHWNDPDMLEIGNGGMTDIEYRTHMSLWAMMAAPLVIGTDLRKATPESLAILGNREIIALDQDPRGLQAAVVQEEAGTLVFAKALTGGDVAVALYNPTDVLARVSVPATRAGLPSASAYRLRDLWTNAQIHAGATLAAGVPAHGTVVYRVSPLAEARELPPSVSVSGELAALTPRVPGGATLSASVGNHGTMEAAAVSLTLVGPSGWSLKALDTRAAAPLAAGASATKRWNVTPPADTGPGHYSLTLEARYTWGERKEATASAQLNATVVVPPPSGVSYLSELTPVRATSALGPVERDMAGGGAGEGDGNLITLKGDVHTRGLGTRAPSEIVYYLGKQCSALSTQVGLDDAGGATGAAQFKVFADGRLVAQSGPLSAAEPPRTLDANLAGAAWLRLVAEPTDTSYGTGGAADWASPRLTCGTKPTPRDEHALFSFDNALPEGFQVKGSGGSFKSSSRFHTDGKQGLEAKSSTDGNWFGASFSAPLDLRTATRLAFDVATDATGTPGELAVEVGPEKAWCQGGRWAWTNPGSTKTIKTAFKDMSCPAGVRLDQAKIMGVWVFLKGGTFTIDSVRAE